MYDLIAPVFVIHILDYTHRGERGNQLCPFLSCADRVADTTDYLVPCGDYFTLTGDYKEETVRLGIPGLFHILILPAVQKRVVIYGVRIFRAIPVIHGYGLIAEGVIHWISVRKDKHYPTPR